MSLLIERIAEAFSRHDFAVAYPYLAEDVEWDLVGDRRVTGRDAVIATCIGSTEYLATVTTSFERFRVLSGPDFAVVDSVAEYVDGDGGSSRVASCDLYAFADGLLRAITSYTVELPREDQS